MTAIPSDFQGIPIASRGGEGPEWLYRFYGDEGLLYVGITRTGLSRFESHRKEKAWWPYVERIEVELYPTRSAVRIAECNAIADERPAFNVADRGPYAAQSAREAERRKQLVEELNAERAKVERLKAENKRLHGLLKSGITDRQTVEAQLGENVVQLDARRAVRLSRSPSLYGHRRDGA